MDRYQKVEKPKPESPVNENEIRITSQGLVRNYVSYATTLLQERRVREIVLKAMGQAISKTVAIAEIIKRRVPRLHQDTAISSVSITDTFEPIEEGLQTVEQTRHVSMISITLSTKELNKTSPGYQAPFNVDQTKQQQYNYQPQQQQPPRQARAIYNTGNGDTYGRGRGRGRGDEVGTEVDIQTTKVAIQVDILTGAVVAVVGVGVIVELDMEEAEVEVGEDMGEGVEGWVVDRGVGRWRHPSIVGSCLWFGAAGKCLPWLQQKKSENLFHVIHKVPSGDGPYVRAKHAQLVEKDPETAIVWFWKAINSGDRVDSALKDMAVVMKQLDRTEEAIEAVKSFRALCSRHAQESLDNVLIDLYKKCGKVDEQIVLLKHKLKMIYLGRLSMESPQKLLVLMARSFRFPSLRKLPEYCPTYLYHDLNQGNLGWAYMQKMNFIAAEVVYRKAQMIDPDANKALNLCQCLIKQARYEEANWFFRMCCSISFQVPMSSGQETGQRNCGLNWNPSNTPARG
ncbi:UNVERIFIED_CONTAM: protein SULFUR DEFICIENCY-INDUCED 1 [Sesamum calycinum]|uniref:Protein SULFUR DEFICIENCY-INDUCED 1 n=1 Tax=Sesamum calycinum TaxID=2727403 RepID=A0AAW2SE46_9LAMI